jgi:tetratricopeptide (TPR) repeat protein
MNFFISRAGEDSGSAKWIAAVLQAAGHTTTLQDYDFQSGSFPEHIDRALHEADKFIAVMSPYYLQKPFTQAELQAAYARDPLHLIIPVHVAPCQNPDLIRYLIYLDFVGKDDDQRKRALLDAIGTPSRKPEIRTYIRRLPTVDPNVFGRDAQIAWLEQAWSNPNTNLVQIVAPGGAGKTALMTNWYRRHLDDATVFGWSFYGQGAEEQSQTSSDEFFDEALPWFKIAVPDGAPVSMKVDLLIERLRAERMLLILDGVEPLQNPGGSLRDPALQTLLTELAAYNAGLVLCTTRARLEDIPDDPPRALRLDLENLDPADGARYLAHLGVLGTADELRAASEAYGNHALALTLLGTYLIAFCDSDIRRRTEIRELQVDETKPGQRARQVMASYARMYQGRPELDILRALSYFNGPAERDALKLVLPAMEDRKVLAALKSLRDARLILTAGPGQPLDCHPLVREHFAPDASPETRDGHSKLYEYYKQRAPERPDTLEAMTPLFRAVYHGCQAGQHLAAINDVYLDRVRRRDVSYLNDILGAFATDLSLLANFFERPWDRPAPTLPPGAQSWLVAEAGFGLNAVGRLTEAVEPMRTAAEAAVAKDPSNAAIRYDNLSEIHLTLGNVAEAVATARQSVELADLARDRAQRIASRTALAHALHQSGDAAEAGQWFTEAERLHAQGRYPILYSVFGYRYCDLLLAQGRNEEVLRRATQMLSWEEESWPLDLGLDHLLLGRATADSADAAKHLDQAVDFLRLAGRIIWTPELSGVIA